MRARRAVSEPMHEDEDQKLALRALRAALYGQHRLPVGTVLDEVHRYVKAHITAVEFQRDQLRDAEASRGRK